MRFQIVTCNSKYVETRYLSSYHEIHEIDGLQSAQHVIATINSIVANNLLFRECGTMTLHGFEDYSSKYDTKLDAVIISSDDPETLRKVINYFKEYPICVEVQEVESYMMKEELK